MEAADVTAQAERMDNGRRGKCRVKIELTRKKELPHAED
jgi:hypothetical protein